MAVTPDGRRAVSASGDNTLKVWDLETGSALRTLEGHSDWVTGVAVTPDGRRARLRVCGQNAEGVGPGNRQRPAHPGGPLCWVNGVAVTPDGRRAVSASYDNTLKVWDLETGTLLVTFTCDAAALCCTFAGPRRIVAGDAAGRSIFSHWNWVIPQLRCRRRRNSRNFALISKHFLLPRPQNP